MNSAQEITKRSKSNLALAFFSLPRPRREAITIFYAFCRHIDDLADDGSKPVEERRDALRTWRDALRRPIPGEPPFAADVRQIIRRYEVNLGYLDDILDGVESDLLPVRFQTFSDLSAYCYRVASAVGLVSIEIFGYRNPQCKRYAYVLGHALQLTNIIRDVEVDLQNGGRIYLPVSELPQYGYSEAQLRDRNYNAGFLRAMQAQSERAHGFFREARRLLPGEDVRSMVAAELMRVMYLRLLRKIEADRFRMFYRRYRLRADEKLVTIATVLASNRLGTKP
ncbi:MAG: squalene/phytoene synthase family protein [Verrucomicrobia bacterium]|nr:squalene/phytoene synthase family protein [Verrucomicrobiota bacterium]